MRVIYDHQIFSVQRYGGISRYFYELFKHSFNTTKVDIKITTILSNNIYLNSLNNSFSNDIHGIRFRGKHRIISFVNNFYTKYVIKRQDFDIFHPTYYETNFLNYIDGKPFVLTVHDMIHEKFPEMFDENDKTSENKRVLCCKAAKIIAVSENTKKDLIQIFAIDESKIEVIYHGNSISKYTTYATYKNNLDLPDRYILFVGSRKKYKNFEMLIESIFKILIENRIYLLCAGGGNFSKEELVYFQNLGINNNIKQYDVIDKELASLYSNALFFVFPTLYEGFGMPILESFSCNCPVACSNISSLPEVAGDAAEYFNPYEKKSISNSVNKLIKNKSYRENLVIKGSARLSFFSWDKTFKKTMSVYEKLQIK